MYVVYCTVGRGPVEARLFFPPRSRECSRTDFTTNGVFKVRVNRAIMFVLVFPCQVWSTVGSRYAAPSRALGSRISNAPLIEKLGIRILLSDRHIWHLSSRAVLR